MASQKVKLAKLVEKAVDGNLNNGEEKKLFRRLIKKFLRTGLESFKEKVVLSAFMLFDDRISRTKYIKDEMAKWRERVLAIDIQEE